MQESKIFILFLIGLILTIFGLAFKLMEWSFASLFLIVGMTFEAVTGFILIYKLLKK